MDDKTEGRIFFILGLAFALATFVADRMAPDSPLITNLAALVSVACFLVAIWLTLPIRIRWRCWKKMPEILMVLSIVVLAGAGGWRLWRIKHPPKEPLPDYVYVVTDAFASGPFRLAVINPGKNPVLNVSLRIFDAKKSPASMIDAPVQPIGDIEPGYMSLNLPQYRLDITRLIFAHAPGASWKC